MALMAASGLLNYLVSNTIIEKYKTEYLKDQTSGVHWQG